MINNTSDNNMTFLCLSILSLACSPSGSSFVCSAAALNRSGSVESAPQLPIPVSGQLLLWDTKTVKQQVVKQQVNSYLSEHIGQDFYVVVVVHFAF